MANRKLRVLFKKIYPNGDIDTIFFKSRAKDVIVSEDSTQTMADIATKVNASANGATKVEKSNTNGNVKINGQETSVYSHPNSGVTAGTYNSVTVDAKGHVTGATKVTNWDGTVSGDGSNETVAFSQASSRANIASGEKHSTMFGKIAKWFADLKLMAFVDSVGTANLDSTLITFYNKRLTTDNVTESTSITEAGWIADARVIATLQNQINTLNSNLDDRNIVADLFAIADEKNDCRRMVMYDNSTLNTPYKAGLTSLEKGLAIIIREASNTYTTIFAIPTGGNINSPFICTKSLGEWGEWRDILVNTNYYYHSSNLETVADNGLYSPQFVKCNENTLNTPYKAGLTNCSIGSAYISTASTKSVTILYIPTADDKIFIRNKKESIWYDWKTIDINHNHDDIYYRETEIDNLLSSWKIKSTSETFVYETLSVVAKRVRNTVYVNLYGKGVSTLKINTDYTIATLPETYRPYYNLPWNTYIDQGSPSDSTVPVFLLKVHTDGTVHLNVPARALSSNRYINVVYTYPVW